MCWSVGVNPVCYSQQHSQGLATCLQWRTYSQEELINPANEDKPIMEIATLAPEKPPDYSRASYSGTELDGYIYGCRTDCNNELVSHRFRYLPVLKGRVNPWVS